MNVILETILRVIGGVVDSFKMKNPVVFTVVGAVLLGVYALSNELLQAVTDVGEPLLSAGMFKTISWMKEGIVALLFLLGAHTPQIKK
jgi:hypothetical protein